MSELFLRASAQQDGSFPVAELSPPVRPQPSLPAEPYELGLTSAGAISAGAYIAGVMDLLVQALDLWQEAKQNPELAGRVPDHDVLVRVVTGASAGALNAALLGILRDRRFTHHATDPNGGAETGVEAATGNPIFDTWVNRISIDKLTGDEDVRDGQTPLSLLDGSPLGLIATEALADSCRLPEIARPWLADPLRVILTQTNSRGVPYFVPFAGGGAGQGMLQHGDQARFAIATPGGTPQQAAFPDEKVLMGSPTPASDWNSLSGAALASAAFPVGLPPRQMQAKPADYAYKVYYEEAGDLFVVPPHGRNWPAPGQPGYNDPRPYVGIDGGVIDNDPFGVAHDVLAGGLGRNPRAGDKATRSVLMVDPFPAAPDEGPAELAEMTLPKAVTNLFGVTKDQARFKPKDLILAQMEDVFSRFIIVPKKAQPAMGKYSLACGFLGGFGGFLSRRQRVHDFMLGRRNAQKLLLDHLVLPIDNPLFERWRNAPWAESYYARRDVRDADGNVTGQEIARDAEGKPFLPIIPLLRQSDGQPLPDRLIIGEQQELPWPTGAVDPPKVAALVVARAKALAENYTAGLGWIARNAVRAALNLWGYGALRDQVRTRLSALKAKWGL